MEAGFVRAGTVIALSAGSVLAVGAYACRGAEGQDPGDSPAPDDTSDTADTGRPDTADTGETGPVHTGEPRDTVVRFIVVGDAGEDDAHLAGNAATMRRVCAERGCDLVLMLGDNFYQRGVTSADDPDWETTFHEHFDPLGIPVFPVLGGHDYGGNAEFDEPRARAQIEHSERASNWRMPDFWYRFAEAHVTFVALDTHRILMRGEEPQAAWVDDVVAGADTPWVVAFGHNPHVSNGPGGTDRSNARFRDFADAHLCGKVDLYLSGHDHTLQWLEPQCGTHFLVSGAGSHHLDLLGGSWPSYFERAAYGFAWVEIDGDTLSAAFYTSDGKERHVGSVTR